MTEPAQSKTGLPRLLAATGHSLRGYRAAWQGEAAFRQEILASVLLLPAAFWIGQTLAERLLLIGSVLLVLITELLNSAIECAIDRIGKERHELSGRAKDIGSAAVMTALILWLAVWLSLLVSRLIQG